MLQIINSTREDYVINSSSETLIAIGSYSHTEKQISQYNHNVT